MPVCNVSVGSVHARALGPTHQLAEDRTTAAHTRHQEATDKRRATEVDRVPAEHHVLCVCSAFAVRLFCARVPMCVTDGGYAACVCVAVGDNPLLASSLELNDVVLLCLPGELFVE